MPFLPSSALQSREVTCEATSHPSPSAICSVTPRLIRFPAAGQKDRSEEEGRRKERRGGKKMWVGGELWKDWKRASAAFASSPVFSIKYGSQKHIPAAELSQKVSVWRGRCEGVSALCSDGIRKGKRKKEERIKGGRMGCEDGTTQIL